MAKEKKEFKKLRNILLGFWSKRPLKVRLVCFKRFTKPVTYRYGDKVLDSTYRTGVVQTADVQGAKVLVQYARNDRHWFTTWSHKDLTLIVPAANTVPHK